MAIAIFTIDLNGGDVETADNALYFKIYGSADGYTTPILTTGTDLADLDVSTNAGIATITNVDIGTETSFKVGVLDGDDNESNLSAIYTISGQDPSELYSAASAATYAGTENNQATGFVEDNQTIISVVTDDVGFGAYSVKLIPRSGSTFMSAVVNIPTTAGKTYRIKARMKRVGTLPNAQLYLSNTLGWSGASGSSGLISTSWTDYTIDQIASTTQSTTKIKFYLVTNDTWDGTSYILVDQLSVIELP